jgi:hypothetical protein
MPHAWPLLAFAIGASQKAIDEAGRWIQERLGI